MKERQEPFDVCLFVATFDLSCGTPAIEKKEEERIEAHTAKQKKNGICFVNKLHFISFDFLVSVLIFVFYCSQKIFG